MKKRTSGRTFVYTGKGLTTTSFAFGTSVATPSIVSRVVPYNCFNAPEHRLDVLTRPSVSLVATPYSYTVVRPCFVLSSHCIRGSTRSTTERNAFPRWTLISFDFTIPVSSSR